MNTVPTTPQPGESHPHYQTITGLLELAGFLTDHPVFPGIGNNITIYVDGTDSEMIAQVRDVARLLDVDPRWHGPQTEGHFLAERKFGAIRLTFLAIMNWRMQIHNQAANEITAKKMEMIAARTAAAAEPVELVVAVDDQAPVVEQLPAAAAPVDEGQADGDAAADPQDLDRAAREIHAAAAVAGESLQPCEECKGSGSGFAGECTSCWGSGRVLAEPPKCATCEGAMVKVDAFGLPTGEPCESCHGTGYVPPVVSAW